MKTTNLLLISTSTSPQYTQICVSLTTNLIRYQASGVRCQVTGVRSQVLGVRLGISPVTCHLSLTTTATSMNPLPCKVHHYAQKACL